MNSSEIADIIKKYRRVAVVGASPRANRPSNQVTSYLLDSGFEVFPVNPGQNKILGCRCYPDLKSVPPPLEIIDIFRRAELVGPVVDEAITRGAKVVWMQEGIVNEEAAARALAAGLKVVMDRCLKIEHYNFNGLGG